MSKHRNVAASVRARLFALSKERKEDFTLTLLRYANERLLYRIGQSPYRDRFVLKGAMLFAVWGDAVYRPTRDIDLLGLGMCDKSSLETCFHDLCEIHTTDDGIVFLPKTIMVQAIRDTTEYGGMRVRILSLLEQAEIQLQIDIGIGDVIIPPAEYIDFPTLLKDSAQPRIRAYPKETVIAEKIHAMVTLGSANSRMKDFYDLYTLSREFPFKGSQLKKAITATFERRGTEIPTTTASAMTSVFYIDQVKSTQWSAFLNRSHVEGVPEVFTEVGNALIPFVSPILKSSTEAIDFNANWDPDVGWKW